ncbi:odorant receptor 22c-like [Athalia rosae]|uniref:odorant receptor 22c-like n=1 Tax=Athalia rosae TaxID=37344 RepID=UPI002034066B|nr:odorant receptor 22c-like [Athalia rosae]
MIVIAMHRRRIHRLMSICEALWNDADNAADYKIISAWAKRAKSLTNLLCTFTIFAVGVFVILPIIRQLLPGSDISTRTWPYQINMDATQSPRYELYYALQTCFVCNALCSVIGCDSTGPLLAIHACGQLKLIQTWLLSIFENETDSSLVNGKDEIIVKEKLKKCVQRHQFVMHFCDEIEELVRYANLTQVLAEMYMMAISASRLSRMQGAGIFKQIGPLLMAASQIFISCFASEQLSSESVMVAETAYAIPWYRCSPRIRKMILLIINRSQRPVRLTIGKFGVMSLATFGSIVSTATSVFMLLRSVDST